MFPMQNFEPESAVISASSNSALIEKYFRNTCLGQGVVLTMYHKNKFFHHLHDMKRIRCILNFYNKYIL